MEEIVDLPEIEPSCSASDPSKPIRNQLPGECLVCLNPSTGHHYDVPSCNGCKSFFRRTLIQGDILYCKRAGKCFESPHLFDKSKKVCRGCRFEKCVMAGMNPMGIQTELVKREKARVMIEEILHKKKRLNNKVTISERFISPDEAVNQVISDLDFVEVHTGKIYTGGFPDGFYDFRSLHEILNDPVIFNNSNIPRMIEKPNIDRSCYTKMIFAHCSFLASVEYSKTFDFFRKISFEDKVRLTQHTICACSNLQDAFFSVFDLKSDQLMHPDGSTDGRKGPAGERSGFHLNTLLSILRNRMNRVEYMLLKAIVLCNPTVCSLSPQTQVILEKERQKFAGCLYRYCRLEHGALHGSSRFAAILSLVSVIEHQAKMHKDFHVYVKMVIKGNKADKFPVTTLFDDVLGSS